MQTYKYITLTDDVQHNIKNGLYNRDDLNEIYGGLKEKAEAGQRKMRIVRIILVPVYVLMILPSFMEVIDMSGDTSLLIIIASLLFPLPFFALGYFLARWHSYGMFCHQWNKSMKTGYPLIAQEYRL